MKFILTLIIGMSFIMSYADDYEALYAATQKYVEFLNHAGEFENDSYSDEIPEICAPNCTKVINGKICFNDRNSFAPQLAAIKEFMGTWEANPLDILVSERDHASALRYLLTTEKAGTFIIFIVLRFNSDDLITEINEIYNKFEG